jgi:hypothetical protein
MNYVVKDGVTFEVIEGAEWGTGAKYIQTEESICFFRCEVRQEADGKRHLAFCSTWLP